MKNFDINIDIGEGFEIEKDLMPLIQSCNIACGGHAGSTNEIKKCVALAKKYGVKIGAHPSYPDKKNFGRRSPQIDKKTLAISIEKQLRLFLKNLQSPKDLYHVKPHGALYNDCVKDKQIAQIFLDVVIKCCPGVVIFTLQESELKIMAEKKGFKVWTEAFLDRGYNDNGQLESREKPGAIVSDVRKMYAQLKSIKNHNKLLTINKKSIPIKADTFCFHGDHPKLISNLEKLLELCSNQKNYE